MKKIDMTNVQEAGEFKTLPAGAYICVITAVEDVPNKEYLKVSYDIDAGEFKYYYSSIRLNHPDWAWVGAYAKSYKPTALPMFKRFCSAVSKSNGRYVFDGGSVNADESTLVGKKIGLVLREEEYYSNSGDVRTRLIVHTECPIDKVSSQRVPEPIRVKTEPADTGFLKASDDNSDEIPFI